MVCLSHVLLGLLSAGGDEVLCTHAQGLLHQYPMEPCLSGVQPLLSPPTDCLGCSDMRVSFQDHRLKDDEPIRVMLSVPYPAQLLHQSHHKVLPGLPAWRFVEP